MTSETFLPFYVILTQMEAEKKNLRKCCQIIIIAHKAQEEERKGKGKNASEQERKQQ